MSKTQSLVSGSILRTAQFFASAILGIVLMPFIIHSLGDTTYGLWILVGSFLGYYGLLDLGFSFAIKRYISRALALRDYDDINVLLNTALAILSIMGLVVLVASFIIAIVVPATVSSIPNPTLFKKVVVVLGCSIALGFPCNVFSGFLTADLKFAFQAVIELIKLAVRTVLVIFFLSRGHGIMALALITVAVDLAGYALVYGYVRKTYRYLRLSPALVARSKIRLLFDYSTYAFIAQIADQFRFNIDNLVITAFIGLNAVTLYSIGFRLAQYFKDFIGSALGMTMPVFSQYEGEGDYDSILKKYIFLTKISSYLALFVGSILLMFGRPFIVRWLGDGYRDAYLILLILVIPFTLDMMQPCGGLLYGLSKHKFVTLLNCSESILNLVLSILLVRPYGIYGVALGTAIPMIITRFFIQPIYVCRVIGLGYREFYVQLMLPIVLVHSVLVAMYWLSVRRFVVPDYGTIIAFTVLAGMIFVAVVLLFGFSRSERHSVMKGLTVKFE